MWQRKTESLAHINIQKYLDIYILKWKSVSNNQKHKTTAVRLYCDYHQRKHPTLVNSMLLVLVLVLLVRLKCYHYYYCTLFGWIMLNKYLHIYVVFNGKNKHHDWYTICVAYIVPYRQTRTYGMILNVYTLHKK